MGGGFELNDQLLDPDVPTLASQDKLKVSPKGLPFVNNEGKVSVNAYFINSDEGKQSILLYRKSKVLKSTHHIDLLKLEDGDNYHYVFIKDFNKLMYKQIQSKRKAKKRICRHCRRPFEEEYLLDQHNENGCTVYGG